MNAIACPKCGTENPVGALYCTKCRSNLELALADRGEIERTRPQPVRDEPADALFSYLRDSPAALTDSDLDREYAGQNGIDDATEEILSDYRRKAEGVEHSQDDWIRPAGIALAVLDLVLFFLLRAGTAYLVFLVVAAVAGCVLAALYGRGREESLAWTCGSTPGFAEFFRAWRKDRKLRDRPLAESGEMGTVARRGAAASVAVTPNARGESAPSWSD